MNIHLKLKANSIFTAFVTSPCSFSTNNRVLKIYWCKCMQKIHILFPYINNPSKNFHLHVSLDKIHISGVEEISLEKGTESQNLRVYLKDSFLSHAEKSNTRQVRRELHFWHIPFNICTSIHPTPSKDLQPSIAICTASWPYFQPVWHPGILV